MWHSSIQGDARRDRGTASWANASALSGQVSAVRVRLGQPCRGGDADRRLDDGRVGRVPTRLPEPPGTLVGTRPTAMARHHPEVDHHPGTAFRSGVPVLDRQRLVAASRAAGGRRCRSPGPRRVPRESQQPARPRPASVCRAACSYRRWASASCPRSSSCSAAGRPGRRRLVDPVLGSPHDRRPHIVGMPVEASAPVVVVGLPGEHTQPVATPGPVPITHVVGLPGTAEPFVGVLPDRLQYLVAGRLPGRHDQQMVVGKPGEGIGDVGTSAGGLGDCAAASTSTRTRTPTPRRAGPGRPARAGRGSTRSRPPASGVDRRRLLRW